MIAWLALCGLVLIMVTAPAHAFGWLCGWMTRRMLRDPKPP